MKTRVVASTIVIVFLSSCDGGLSPTVTTVPFGFMSGTIRYQHWPPRDSLIDLRLVAFRGFPPGSIPNEVLAGTAVVYPSIGDTALIPFYVDSLRYVFSLPPGEYQYVVIAQQYGPDLYADWRAVGQYDLDSNLTVPSPVTISPSDTTLDININVDFTNPPPPPQ